MGTWGNGIKENDTSFDVYESFFELYNAGVEASVIKQEILAKFKESYDLEEDRNNVIFPLALCLWEVCALDKELLDEVESLILNKQDISLWKSLGANEALLKKRCDTLDKLLVKLKKPKEKPKQRKKPPILVETDYQAGTCLTFQYPNERYGGVIIITSQTYKNKGDVSFILTDIQSNKAPTFEDFLHAKLVDFKWESVYGQSLRYAAYMESEEWGSTGRLSCHMYSYTGANSRKPFIESFDKIFTIVGKLPPFTQVLLRTTFDSSPETMEATFEYYLENHTHISNESIETLTPLLVRKGG